MFFLMGSPFFPLYFILQLILCWSLWIFFFFFFGFSDFESKALGLGVRLDTAEY